MLPLTDLRRGPPICLCGVDLSDTSPHVVNHGFALAQALGAELHLLHVVDVTTRAFPSTSDRSTDDTYERLAALAHRRAATDLHVQCHLSQGRPAAEILRKSVDLGAALIVLGFRTRSAIMGVLHERVVDGVLRGATVPVVVVNESAGRRPAAIELARPSLHSER